MGEEKQPDKRLDINMKVSLVLRGAIAVVVGSVATMLMFTRLTSSSLMVSYKQGKVGLESASVALLDEVVFSVLIGIASGVIALVIIYGWSRFGGGRE